MEQITLDDTISAIATAVGRGGIGIIRLSGEKALEIADKIFYPANKKSLRDTKSHQVVYGTIKNEKGTVIDEALAFTMHAPRSYTCEDIVEIQSHGGRLILEEILRLTYHYGARGAMPGEFTKRAFLNGRLDLTRAEAVMNIIEAKTKPALFIAANQLEGKYFFHLKNLRQKALHTLAQIEVAIDYPEEDIEEVTLTEITSKIKEIKQEIHNLLQSAKTGKILTHGLKTAIIGKPNVGKSSLFNALLGEERAIVTDIKGTTRDIITETIDCHGIPLDIIDTAGLRHTDDKIEKIGIEKTKDTIQKADLILFLIDQTTTFEKEDEELLDLIQEKEKIILLTKLDRPPQSDPKRHVILERLKQEAPLIEISAKKNRGIEDLQKALQNIVYSQNDTPENIIQGNTLITNARDEELLKKAFAHLEAALQTISFDPNLDLVTIDLREAIDTFGKITGETTSLDLIEEIFQNFCIGK